MANLKSIAQQLNISIMTVSRAINTPEKVSPVLREKIYRLINETNYKPNTAARSLALDKTGIVQVVTPLESTNIYLMHLFMGITGHLSQNGYSLMLSSRQITSHCDGVIAMGLSNSEKADFINSMHYPCVLFGRAEGLSVDCVDINDFKGVYMAVGHLIQRGHERIGYIGYRTNEMFSEERYNGYRKCLSDAGKPFSESWVYKDSANAQESFRRAGAILKNGEVTAFMCANDITAMAVVDAVKDAGLKVPDDISVVGFDGIYEDRLCTPRLTTVAQPVFKIGSALAAQLLKRIAHPNAERAFIEFELELKEGLSVASR